MKKRERLSNFELLRIIAMLMVVFYHYQLHADSDNTIFSGFSINQVIMLLLGSWGTLGVNLFWAVSAYFLLDKEKINYRSIVSVLVKCSVFGTSILVGAYLIGVAPFSARDLFLALFSGATYQYWFITSWILITVLSVAFNKVVFSVNRKYYRIILACLFWCSYLLTNIVGYELVGRTSCGIFIYFTLGYFKRFPEDNFICKKKCTIFVTSIVLVLFYEFGLSALSTFCGGKWVNYARLFQNTQSPLLLVSGLSLFYIIRECNFKSRVVDFVGCHTLGVFLLHGPGKFSRMYLWDGILRAGEFYSMSTIPFVVHYVLICFAMFVIGVLLDYLYSVSIDRAVMTAFDKSIKRFKK